MSDTVGGKMRCECSVSRWDTAVGGGLANSCETAGGKLRAEGVTKLPLKSDFSSALSLALRP